MPLLQSLVQSVGQKALPKVISPKAHAIIDYATAGSFFLMAALMWKRHKRAGISSIVAGAGELANTMLTDFPGGVVREISFRTHGHIDMGLAAMVASMPGFMNFKDDPETRFFTAQALAITAVGALTDFDAPNRSNVRPIRAA